MRVAELPVPLAILDQRREVSRLISLKSRRGIVDCFVPRGGDHREIGRVARPSVCCLGGAFYIPNTLEQRRTLHIHSPFSATQNLTINNKT
jgi:hypothetical protein